MSRDAEISDVVHRFWRALDERDYDLLISLVSESCRWTREALIEGRPAIQEALSHRPTGIEIRHLVTNLTVEADGDSLSARYLLTAFAAMRGEQPGPLDCGSPALLAEMRMRLVNHADGFLVDEIVPNIIFAKPRP